MAEATELQQRIARLFSQEMNLEVPSVDTDLFEGGLLDSLTFVDLLVRLEEEFGRKILLEELEIDDFRSIARIAEFVSKNGHRA